MAKVEISGKEVVFNSNALFLLKYKQIFGEDVLKVLFPIFKAFVPVAKALEIVDVDNLTVQDLGVILPELLDNAEDIEILDLYKILYTMALSADKNIGDFETWLGSFETFPIFDVVSELFPELLQSLSSSIKSKKNMKIQEMKK